MTELMNAIPVERWAGVGRTLDRRLLDHIFCGPSCKEKTVRTQPEKGASFLSSWADHFIMMR
jgi:hypothetical protein